MTDVSFVPTKLHQPREFAFQRVPRAGHDLARKALGLVSPSTRITSPPTEGRLRLWQQRNHSANSWQKASNLALAPHAPLRFVTRLGGRYASLYSFDVWLLLEVAESSLEYDRDFKLPRYAEAGIVESWIVDLPGQRLWVYRQPAGRNYQSIQEYQLSDSLSPQAFPSASLALREILECG